MSDEYVPPVVLPPDDTSVTYPIPWPEYVPPQGAEVIEPGPEETNEPSSTNEGE